MTSKESDGLITPRDDENLVDRRRMLQLAGGVGLGLVGGSVFGASTAFASSGLGKPVTKEPTKLFKEGVKTGPKLHLPARAAYALDINEGEPAQWNEWMAKSCPKFGLGFTSTNSNQNAATQVTQVDGILQRGVAGLMIDAVDTSLTPTLLKAMTSGVAVFALNFPTCTCQLGANQYHQAQVATEAAIKYINANFGGKADIVYINWNSNIGIKPRDAGVKDAIAAANNPNIRLVADIPSGTNETQIGYNIMNTILQKYPSVRVVIGDDTVMEGAVAAMVAAGLGNAPDWLLVGVDGAPANLAFIKSGKSVFKITAGFLLNALGYLPARYTRDWLDGKAIPQVILFNPVLVDSPAAVDKLNADNNNVINVLANPAHKAAYLMELGSISYKTRLNYYNGYSH
jgi:ABC-type sugar transport system substrate-binding protein